MYLKKKGHYVFTVKDNQKNLHHAIEHDTPEEAWSVPVGTEGLEHGRIERRSIKVTSLEKRELGFPGARSIGLLSRHTTDKKTGQVRQETVSLISSFVDPPPAALLAIDRNHWRIEAMFNITDGPAYHEDRQTMHTGNGPLNMTLLRDFAVSCKNLLGFALMPEAQSYFQHNAPKILGRLKARRRLAG